MPERIGICAPVDELVGFMGRGPGIVLWDGVESGVESGGGAPFSSSPSLWGATTLVAAAAASRPDMVEEVVMRDRQGE